MRTQLAIEPIFLTQYNKIIKTYTEKIHYFLFFHKNINDSIHRFLKNAVCIRSFKIILIIAILRSLVCPTVNLRKST